MPTEIVAISGDTYLDDAFPTTKFASTTILQVGWLSGKTPNTFRSALTFDLSSLISNADQILSALLDLEVTTGAAVASPASILYTTEEGLVIANATWDNYDDLSPWAAGGGDWEGSDGTSFNLPTGTGAVQYDVTDTVQAAFRAVSDGIIRLGIKRDSESVTPSKVVYGAGEHATAAPPSLTIDYGGRTPSALSGPASALGKGIRRGRR